MMFWGAPLRAWRVPRKLDRWFLRRVHPASSNRSCQPKPRIALSVYPRTLTRTWNWTRTLSNQRMRLMATSSLLMGYHFRAPPLITNPTRARRRRVTETALLHAQTGRPSSPDEATLRKRHQDTQRSAVNLSRSTGYRKQCCDTGMSQKWHYKII